MEKNIIQWSDKMYSFLTITLKPVIYEASPSDQKQCTKHLVTSTLQPYSHSTVVELTKDYNIHYHSLVKVNNLSGHYKLTKRMFAMVSQHRTIGKFSNNWVTSQQELNEHIDYLQKDYEHTRLFTEAVVHDDFDILNKGILQFLIQDPIMERINKLNYDIGIANEEIKQLLIQDDFNVSKFNSLFL